MIEVETKYRCDDLSALQARLKSLGAQEEPARSEIDQYFNAPDRDFAQTDEALRVRTVGDRTYLTYKGPKLDAVTKTRKELETLLEGGAFAADVAAGFLIGLGFRPTARVAKRRIVHHLQHQSYAVEVCLDDVEKVGQFVEIEILTKASQLDQARAAVLDLAGQLGLSGSERRSYLQLLLESGSAP
jgi:adenylate cyclase class 2